MALMVTESCRHTNQLGTSKKNKTYIITSKNKNLHYAAPECVTTQPDVDSIALRVLLEKMLYLIAPLDTNLLPLPAHEIASRVKQHQGVVSECDGNMNEKLLQDSAAATQTTRNPQWQWLAGAVVRWN